MPGDCRVENIDHYGPLEEYKPDKLVFEALKKALKKHAKFDNYSMMSLVFKKDDLNNFCQKYLLGEDVSAGKGLATLKKVTQGDIDNFMQNFFISNDIPTVKFETVSGKASQVEGGNEVEIKYLKVQLERIDPIILLEDFKKLWGREIGDEGAVAIADTLHENEDNPFSPLVLDIPNDKNFQYFVQVVKRFMNVVEIDNVEIGVGTDMNKFKPQSKTLREIKYTVIFNLEGNGSGGNPHITIPLSSNDDDDDDDFSDIECTLKYDANYINIFKDFCYSSGICLYAFIGVDGYNDHNDEYIEDLADESKKMLQGGKFPSGEVLSNEEGLLEWAEKFITSDFGTKVSRFEELKFKNERERESFDKLRKYVNCFSDIEFICISWFPGNEINPAEASRGKDGKEDLVKEGVKKGLWRARTKLSDGYYDNKLSLKTDVLCPIANDGMTTIFNSRSVFYPNKNKEGSKSVYIDIWFDIGEDLSRNFPSSSLDVSLDSIANESASGYDSDETVAGTEGAVGEEAATEAGAEEATGEAATEEAATEGAEGDIEKKQKRDGLSPIGEGEESRAQASSQASSQTSSVTESEAGADGDALAEAAAVANGYAVEAATRSSAASRSANDAADAAAEAEEAVAEVAGIDEGVRQSGSNRKKVEAEAPLRRSGRNRRNVNYVEKHSDEFKGDRFRIGRAHDEAETKTTAAMRKASAAARTADERKTSAENKARDAAKAAQTAKRVAINLTRAADSKRSTPNDGVDFEREPMDDLPFSPLRSITYYPDDTTNVSTNEEVAAAVAASAAAAEAAKVAAEGAAEDAASAKEHSKSANDAASSAANAANKLIVVEDLVTKAASGEMEGEYHVTILSGPAANPGLSERMPMFNNVYKPTSRKYKDFAEEVRQFCNRTEADSEGKPKAKVISAVDQVKHVRASSTMILLLRDKEGILKGVLFARNEAQLASGKEVVERHWQFKKADNPDFITHEVAIDEMRKEAGCSNNAQTNIVLLLCADESAAGGAKFLLHNYYNELEGENLIFLGATKHNDGTTASGKAYRKNFGYTQITDLEGLEGQFSVDIMVRKAPLFTPLYVERDEPGDQGPPQQVQPQGRQEPQESREPPQDPVHAIADEGEGYAASEFSNSHRSEDSRSEGEMPSSAGDLHSLARQSLRDGKLDENAVSALFDAIKEGEPADGDVNALENIVESYTFTIDAQQSMARKLEEMKDRIRNEKAMKLGNMAFKEELRGRVREENERALRQAGAAGPSSSKLVPADLDSCPGLTAMQVNQSFNMINEYATNNTVSISVDGKEIVRTTKAIPGNGSLSDRTKTYRIDQLGDISTIYEVYGNYEGMKCIMKHIHMPVDLIEYGKRKSPDLTLQAIYNKLKNIMIAEAAIGYAFRSNGGSQIACEYPPNCVAFGEEGEVVIGSESCKMRRDFYIFMEKMDGDVHEFLNYIANGLDPNPGKRGGKIDFSYAKTLRKNVEDQVRKLIECTIMVGIACKDIKPGNFLFKYDKTTQNPIVKMSDFDVTFCCPLHQTPFESVYNTYYPDFDVGCPAPPFNSKDFQSILNNQLTMFSEHCIIWLTTRKKGFETIFDNMFGKDVSEGIYGPIEKGNVEKTDLWYHDMRLHYASNLKNFRLQIICFYVMHRFCIEYSKKINLLFNFSQVGLSNTIYRYKLDIPASYNKFLIKYTDDSKLDTSYLRSLFGGFDVVTRHEVECVRGKCPVTNLLYNKKDDVKNLMNNNIIVPTYTFIGYVGDDDVAQFFMHSSNLYTPNHFFRFQGIRKDKTFMFIPNSNYETLINSVKTKLRNQFYQLHNALVSMNKKITDLNTVRFTILCPTAEGFTYPWNLHDKIRGNFRYNPEPFKLYIVDYFSIEGCNTPEECGFGRGHARFINVFMQNIETGASIP